MIKHPFDISFDSLPDSLPVFVLKDALLLPGGQVPLTMFELPNIRMVQDVLASKDRLIGIISSASNNVFDNGDQNLAKVGCAGRITSFEETSDGRYLLALTGYCRFAANEEISTTRGYLRYKVDWSQYREDLEISLHPDINREKLISLLRSYVDALGMEMDWQVVKNMPSFNVITFFSMSLPFEVRDRQALLEAATVEDRADVLMALIEMATKVLRGA